MKARTTIAGLLAVLSLAACSSSGGGSLAGSSAPGSTSASSPTSSAPAVSTPASSAPATGTSSSANSASLQAALLTTADLGTGYTQDPPDNSPESRLPCTPNEPPLFTQLPPQARSTVSFTSTANDVAVSEDVAQFADAASAARATAISIKGFTCKTGQLDGEPVTFTGSGKITVNGTSVDAAQGWDVTASQFKATAVLVQIGSKFIGLVFAAKPTAGGNVDVQAIVDAAAKRAAAAG